MSDAFGKENRAMPAATLEQEILDPNHPKNEREWWAADEIERLTARVEVLEGALTPFAEALKGNWSHQHDLTMVRAGLNSSDLRMNLTLGNFRRARAVLSASQPAPSQLDDAVNYGIGIALDGKRIDPQDFYLPPAPQKEGE